MKLKIHGGMPTETDFPNRKEGKSLVYSGVCFEEIKGTCSAQRPIRLSISNWLGNRREACGAQPTTLISITGTFQTGANGWSPTCRQGAEANSSFAKSSLNSSRVVTLYPLYLSFAPNATGMFKKSQGWMSL